jgi:pimeloyl-ACP methyl ester carboxylesterase
MSRVFLISGWGGAAPWFSKEKKLLEKLGYLVVIPKMPLKYLPFSFIESNFLKKHSIQENDIIVGKSLGGTLLLRYLVKNRIKVRGLFLVGVPVGGKYSNFYSVFKISSVLKWLKIELFLSLFGYKKSYDWDKIKKCAEYINLTYKDNDFLVPLEQGIFLSKILRLDLNHSPGSDHANDISLESLNSIFQQITV